MNARPGKEKLVARILFWGMVVPVAAGVFFRIFFPVFNFVYGWLMAQIVGPEYTRWVTGFALLSSLVFTGGVLFWIHKHYKKHILSTF